MSLLEHPDAQALLADAVVTTEQVRGCQDRLTDFLQRYLPRFYRAEQRTRATLVIQGLLSGLQRKTCEPIAVEAGVHRKPVQNFVGAGKWDDEDVMAELRDHVRERLADPEEVKFQESWRIGVDLLKRCRQDRPHGWVGGDDELGRPARFRNWLRRHGERYGLDVPCNTNVGDLECRRPPRRRAGRGRRREVRSRRADAWAARQPDSRRTRFTVGDGERGPLEVDAMMVRVKTKEERRVGPEGRLMVTRTVEVKPRAHYSLSNAGPEVPLSELVRVKLGSE
jgi:hypothetical protein